MNLGEQRLFLDKFVQLPQNQWDYFNVSGRIFWTIQHLLDALVQ